MPLTRPMTTRPTLFIAYTVKGYGLPLAGHKDNHSGMMNPPQIAQLRDSLGIAEGDEWEPWAGLGDNAAAQSAGLCRCQRAGPPAARNRWPQWCRCPRGCRCPMATSNRRRSAFGRILLDLAKSGDPLADRIVTTAPDVTQTTNLGAFVNQRGLFRRQELADVFQKAKIPSAQKWARHAAGQHIELGIAENNFFLLLASLGLAAPHFGTRLLPVGTVYDPFIARGLDALNYGCYQDARFLLVGTPSGITLAAEGGAHQSINTPLIGMGQPNLTSFEPAFADEVALHDALGVRGTCRGPAAVRSICACRPARSPRCARDCSDWEADALKGGYWLRRPAPNAEAAIVFSGVVAPEALQAWEQLADDMPGIGLLNVTSPDLLHRGWSAARASRWTVGNRAPSHVETLLSALRPGAGLVTMLDGAPAALSWLGGVKGMRVSPLGVDCIRPDRRPARPLSPLPARQRRHRRSSG